MKTCKNNRGTKDDELNTKRTKNCDQINGTFAQANCSVYLYGSTTEY
jgi:hypothetical protein